MIIILKDKLKAIIKIIYKNNILNKRRYQDLDHKE